jgi:anaphase-promoting complex subunit 4
MLRNAVMELPADPQKTMATGHPRVTHLSWGANFLDSTVVKVRTDQSRRSNSADHRTTDTWDGNQENVTLDDFLEPRSESDYLLKLDLPKQLSMIDVESLMPKLSTIPDPPAANQMFKDDRSMGLFSTQQSMDLIFRAPHLKDSSVVDVLLRCRDDGRINITVYNTLDLEDISIPPLWSQSKCLISLASSHPYANSHILLMEFHNEQLSQSKTSRARGLAMVPITLRSLNLAGSNLHLIASKSTQLQNLLSYIDQTSRCLMAFWSFSQDLPSKFVQNISESLAEKESGGLIENLYHLAVTGDCPATIKEWLVDELTEAVGNSLTRKVATSSDYGTPGP